MLYVILRNHAFFFFPKIRRMRSIGKSSTILRFPCILPIVGWPTAFHHCLVKTAHWGALTWRRNPIIPIRATTTTTAAVTVPVIPVSHNKKVCPTITSQNYSKCTLKRLSFSNSQEYIQLERKKTNFWNYKAKWIAFTLCIPPFSSKKMWLSVSLKM